MKKCSLHIPYKIKQHQTFEFVRATANSSYILYGEMGKCIFLSPLPFKKGHIGHVEAPYAVEFAANKAHKSEAQHQIHQAWGK